MVTTRPAERRDIEAATRLAHDAYQHYAARIGRPPAPMEADYAATVADRTMWVAEDEARARGYGRIELHTNEAMTENLAYYPHKGYVETHREEQDGYRRVFFAKSI